MWVMKRKRQIHSKPRSHDPHIIPLWLTLWLLSSFCLHSPVSLFSQPLLFKLSTHLFTESGLWPLQGYKLLQMTVVSFLLPLSGVHSQFFWIAVMRNHGCKTPQLLRSSLRLCGVVSKFCFLTIHCYWITMILPFWGNLKKYCILEVLYFIKDRLLQG